MKGKLYSKHLHIGDANLQIWDRSMGVLGGEFIPNSNYKQIRKTVCDYNDPNSDALNSEYYSLNLNCQLSNEIFLLPQGGILIQDLDELDIIDIKVSIAGVRYEFIEIFFEKENIYYDILEPWESISIKQKLAFEEELHKEIGTIEKLTFSNFFKTSRRKHILDNAEVSALCKRGDSDDVLFELKSEKIKEQFVVVHLTWSGKKEQNMKWPLCNFFNNFKEFSDQMKIDNEEY